MQLDSSYDSIVSLILMIDVQLATIEHMWLIVSAIRGQLDAYNRYTKSLSDGDSEKERINMYCFDNYTLGSRQPSQSVSTLEASHSNDPAFQHFRARLERYLTVLLSISDCLPHGQPVKLSCDHEVCIALV